jgi:hypothetical protein
VTWALGRSFFHYDLARADSMAKLKGVVDSVRADSIKTLLWHRDMASDPRQFISATQFARTMLPVD